MTDYTPTTAETEAEIRRVMTPLIGWPRLDRFFADLKREVRRAALAEADTAIHAEVNATTPDHEGVYYIAHRVLFGMANPQVSASSCSLCGCRPRTDGFYSGRCPDTGCSCHGPGGSSPLTFDEVVAEPSRHGAVDD